MSIVLAFALATATATATTPQDFEGKGNWRGTFDAKNCVVVRDYVRGKSEAQFFVKVLPFTNTLYIAIREKGFANVDRTLPATVRFGEHEVLASAHRYETPGNRRVTQFIIPADLDWIRELDRVELGYGKTDYSFSFDFAKGVANGLDDCIGKQEAAMIPAGGSGPQGDVRTLFSADDYPGLALIKRTGSILRAQLLVDPEGRVERCDVTMLVGDPLIPLRTCIILTERARFNPARDAAGNAITSVFEAPQIAWMIEGEDVSLLWQQFRALDSQRMAAGFGRTLPLDPADLETIRDAAMASGSEEAE